MKEAYNPDLINAPGKNAIGSSNYGFTIRDIARAIELSVVQATGHPPINPILSREALGINSGRVYLLGVVAVARDEARKEARGGWHTECRYTGSKLPEYSIEQVLEILEQLRQFCERKDRRAINLARVPVGRDTIYHASILLVENPEKIKPTARGSRRFKYWLKGSKKSSNGTINIDK